MTAERTTARATVACRVLLSSGIHDVSYVARRQGLESRLSEALVRKGA